MARVQTTIGKQPINKYPIASAGPEIINVAVTAANGVMVQRATTLDMNPELGLFSFVYMVIPPPLWSLVQHSNSLYFSPVNTTGYLFITLRHGDDTWRVSNEMLDGGEFLWDQRLLSLPSIQFTAKERGGYVKVSWGSLQFLPDSFTSGIDAETSLPIVIPPPDEVEVEARWGLTDSASTLVFEGEAYLRSTTETTVSYDLFEEEFKNHALPEGISPEGSYVVSGILDLGNDLVEVTLGRDHDFAVGEEVVLQKVNNDSNFTDDDDYYIQTVGTGADAAKFQITIPGYSASTGYDAEYGQAQCGTDIIAIPLVIGTVEHAILPKTVAISGYAQKYYRPNFAGTAVGEDLHLFDDGVPIDTNFPDDNDVNHRYLEPSTNPIGKLSASGTGCWEDPINGTVSLTTLKEVFEWAVTKLKRNNVPLELNTDKADSNIALNCIITEEMLLVDLLDKLAGYCNHSFYILGGTLYLSDNSQSTANLGVYEDGDLFSMSLGYEMPTRMHQAKWKVNEAGFMRTDGTSGQSSTLQATERDIFIKGSSPLGDVRDYKVYDQKRVDVRSKVKKLKQERDKVNFQAEIPLEGLPPIGCEILYLEDGQTVEEGTRVLVRSLTYNFEEYSISIKGKVTPLV